MEHGADAYPFTKESMMQLKAEMEEKAKLWPAKIRHEEHSHVLWKSKREYICDSCGKRGRHWSFYCKQCDFDLHPDCALDARHEVVDSEEEEEEEAEWPKRIKHMLHKHVLVKAWRHYQCDACGVIKQGWSYFCEVCDFDLHPMCALGDQATIKVIDDSDDEFDTSDDDDEDENEDEDDIHNHGNFNENRIRNSDDEHLVKVEDEDESLHSDFKQELKLGDDKDGDEEKEEKKSKKENHEDVKVEDDDENDGEDDSEEEEEDEDGPGMRGYICNTMDREGSESFQESLFTCRLYK
ncbi:serine/threonine-protein phosphatase 4 regulatory subunit 2-like [Phalaenopsis equestris]|uniref:serine/threonine-protein phosphatase 4 regulatory subunit 2-like n=2 Tax=Phalaenopsis equestris TaxID=78828 RepID=UPI0009E4E7D6|nr:serine/threonine-protein phosphatase 4 regulatory subunit 2-like [Phalaenopsis equestris]